MPKVRMITAALIALIAVFLTINFILSPKDALYWSRHIWIGQVSAFCVAWVTATVLYPKKRSGWGMELVGLAFACGLAIMLVAMGLQYFR